MAYLGYIEQSKDQNTSDESNYLTSFVGGLPNWINIDNLPNPCNFICNYCNNILVFLLQIYAPLKTPVYYHRIVYIFICYSCNKGVRAFVQCLEQINEYIDTNRQPTKKLISILEKNLCKYCCLPTVDGVPHQKCYKMAENKSKITSILPKYFIYVEEDYIIESKAVKYDLLALKLINKKYGEIEKQLDDNGNEISETSKKQMNIGYDNNDEILDNYLQWMCMRPEHIILYNSDEPVWFCSKNINKHIPICKFCNEKMIFEFQVHSTVLDYVEMLTNYEMYFGILVVYRCKNNCNSNESVYIYRQNDPIIDEVKHKIY